MAGGKSRKTIKNNDNNGEIQSKDRLSSLPDAVLTFILSLLPITNAAATAVISRRWRHLWTFVTAIRYSTFNLSKHRFFTIAGNCILPNLTFPLIDTFEFQGPIPKPNAIDDFSSFISRLCLLHVRKIKVCFKNRHFVHLVLLPSSVFETQSLETLILSEGFEFELPHDKVSLPNLRNLRVAVFSKNIELMEKLLNFCPVLEDLWIDGKLADCIEPFIHITCHNLKSLHLSLLVKKPFKVVIDAPKLERFHFGGSNLVEYSFANDFVSLVEAELCTSNVIGLNNTAKRWELLRSLDHVRNLSTGGDISVHDWYNGNEVLPCFYNLIELRMNVLFPTCWRGLMHLLKDCPSLEVLVIRMRVCIWRDMNWFTLDLPTCLSSKIKRIEIWNLWGNQSQLELIRFILNVAKVLETLVVNVKGTHTGSTPVAGLQDEVKFSLNLYGIQRSFPACRIRFCGDYVNEYVDKMSYSID